jgi:acyl-CoA synthetase (NDP forming)
MKKGNETRSAPLGSGDGRTSHLSPSGVGPGANQVSKEAVIRALDGIFNASSVAVVGASGDPTKLGYMTLNSIIKGGYEGKVYPVNPKGGEILGLNAYSTIGEIDGAVDLAVIIVAAEFVPEVMRQLADKGVRGAVILSAGFREAGRADLEDEVASIALQAGIRFVGPNVQGINFLPNKLCAMFFPVITTRGPMAVITQSGSATAALSEWAAFEGFGISAAVNLGNQVDLCESDYLEFFGADEHAKAMAMYIEGVKDGRRFMEALSRASVRKPVVILKSGRSELGRKAAASHTGSLAGSQDVFEAACRQVGALTAQSIEDLYDRTKGVALIKPPKGGRLLSMSTSGGMGALAADEAELEGLTMPSLLPRFVDEFKRLNLSPLATMANPLDLGYVQIDAFKQAALLADHFGLADVILLNLGDPVPGAVEAAEYLADTIGASLVVSYLGGGEEEKSARIRLHRAGIAVYPSPERAVRGIGAAVRYAAWRSSEPEPFDWSSMAISPDIMKRAGGYVAEPEAVARLKSYGVPYPRHALAHNPKEAARIAEEIGFPVVLKVVSPDTPHKTDVGGVELNLSSSVEVELGFENLIQRVASSMPKARIEGVLVCGQEPEGVEVIVGSIKDPIFGPTVMFGLGGVFAEVLKDVSFRIAPLKRHDAEEMIREIQGYRILTGMRGRGQIDFDALVDLLSAVSTLICDRPEIMELDLNPVRLYEKGLSALDVRLLEAELY